MWPQQAFGKMKEHFETKPSYDIKSVVFITMSVKQPSTCDEMQFKSY